MAYRQGGYGQKRQYNNNSNNNYQGSQGNYNQNNQGNYQQNNNSQPEPKKSWAVYSKIRKGKNEGLLAVNAFRQTRFGLQTASCMPVSDKVYTGKDKGHDFMRYAVALSNPQTGTTQTYWCLMRMDTQTIVIKELSVCITPNGDGMLRNGRRVKGYFGKNYKSR